MKLNEVSDVEQIFAQMETNRTQRVEVKPRLTSLRLTSVYSVLANFTKVSMSAKVVGHSSYATVLHDMAFCPSEVK